MPDVAAIVFRLLKDVAEAAQGRMGASGAMATLASESATACCPASRFALYFLGVGVNSFDIITDIAVGETVFLMRDASGFLLHCRYVLPFLLSAGPHPPRCVELLSCAQALMSWLVAMPGLAPHLFGLHAPTAQRQCNNDTADL